jgi:hypothetical protein
MRARIASLLRDRVLPLAKRRNVQVGVAIAVVAAAAGAAALLLLSNDDDGTRPAPKGIEETPVSAAQLRELRRVLEHDVYWLGPRRSYSYELTETADKSVYVRYLPPGVLPGDPRAFTVVATYRDRRPLRRLRMLARNRGRITSVRGGGRAVISRAKPTSVYLSYPGTDLVIEVFDPSPARARRLAISGRVVPVR